jgi:hypothetical protein
MNRRGTHAQRRRAPLVLEHLEDRTVLTLAGAGAVSPYQLLWSSDGSNMTSSPKIIGTPVGNPADLVVEPSSGAGDGLSTQGYSGNSPPMFSVVMNLSTIPGAQIVWQGPETSVATLRAPVVGPVELPVDASIAFLLFESRPAVPAVNVTARAEQATPFVEQPSGSLALPIPATSPSAGGIATPLPLLHAANAMQVALPVAFSTEDPVPVSVTRPAVSPASTAESRDHYLRLETLQPESGPEWLSGSAPPEQLPAEVRTVGTVVGESIDLRSGKPDCTRQLSLAGLPANCASEFAPVSEPQREPEFSVSRPAREDDWQPARTLSWPVLTATGGMFVFVYQKAMNYWRRAAQPADPH